MTMPAEPGGGSFQPQNRNEAMNQGINGAGTLTPAVPTSFLARQASMNSGGPAHVKLTGSGNGMSAGQTEATMGGMLKPQNGIATDNYNNMKWQNNQ